MAEHLWFPEFRDEQRLSRYPFADTATLISDTGEQIENDAFLDASLYPIGGLGRMYLSQIDVSPREIVLYISDEESRVLATAVFDPLDPEVRLLQLTDGFSRPAGVLVSEPLKLAAFGAWPSGSHAFRTVASEFVASVCIPTPEVGVRGILTDKGELLTGDVWIVGDNGALVRDDDGNIRVDLIGDPLFRRKLCFPAPLSRFRPPLFLKTINGCPPDELGNFNLTVGDHFAPDTVLRIYPFGKGLKIEAVGKRIKGN